MDSKPMHKPEKRCPIACVLMAAGVGSRYQLPDPADLAPETAGEKGRGAGLRAKGHDNKLTAVFRGKPMLVWALDCLGEQDFTARVAVVRADETAKLVPQNVFRIVWNRGEDTSPSKTIRCGLSAVPEDAVGCLFAVGDQPLLTEESVKRLCETFAANPERIVRLSWEGKPGNPVIFPRALFPELLALKDGESGKTVMRRHPERVMLVEAGSEWELQDIDTKANLREVREGSAGRHS